MQVKKNPKADLSQYSLIFFQIGLIIVLGITYFGIEWKFVETETSQAYEIVVPDMDVEEIPVTELKDLPPPPPPPPPVPEIIEVVADNLEVEETEIQSTETSLEDEIQVIQVSEIVEEKLEEKVEEVPFVLIAEVPVYPGCEELNSNAEKKHCMSSKIDALIQKEFKTELGAELNLYGINRIYAMFKIDEYGKVTDIRVRGPHKILEEEAQRVIKMLPDMTPGRQRNRAVRVSYTLPITFEVREHEM